MEFPLGHDLREGRVEMEEAEEAADGEEAEEGERRRKGGETGVMGRAGGACAAQQIHKRGPTGTQEGWVSNAEKSQH